MAVIDFRVARQRIARMQIERHVEPLRRCPERPVLRQVVIDRHVGVADLREAIHQRAAETQLFHTALKLARRDPRDPASPARQGPKAIGPLADLLGEIIVGAAGNVVGVRRIGNCLYRRRVKRQQHRFDAVLIHQLKPPRPADRARGFSLPARRDRENSLGNRQGFRDSGMSSSAILPCMIPPLGRRPSAPVH